MWYKFMVKRYVNAMSKLEKVFIMLMDLAKRFKA